MSYKSCGRDGLKGFARDGAKIESRQADRRMTVKIMDIKSIRGL